MRKEELDRLADTKLYDIADKWYNQMQNALIPFISLPTRTKHNIEYDERSEVWKYGDRETLRNANNAKGATHLLKMAYVVWFIRQQLRENRSST
ncbi:MAG: DNA topoisomerase VI, partial [Methanomicrobium sp.]|nr:DNA topoisomerase VI [Methanomicrobium sp.]